MVTLDMMMMMMMMMIKVQFQVILIIVLEHLMLLVKLGISAAIPDVPHHVAVQVPDKQADNNDDSDDDNDYDRLFYPAGKGRVQTKAT